MISAVFGSDGGAFNSDWVQLYNPTDAPISLGTISGSTVTPNYYQCYRSLTGSTGTACSSMALYGTVEPHHYFLIWDGHNSGNSGLPPAGITPDLDFAADSADDAKSSTDPSGQQNNGFGGYSTGGQILLMDASKATATQVVTTNDLSSATAQSEGVVDAVAWTKYSSSAYTQPTSAETNGSTTITGASMGTSNKYVSVRTFVDGIPQDTNSNSADFTAVLNTSFTLQSQASSQVTIGAVGNTKIAAGAPMSNLQVTGSGGVAPLTYSASGLPAGVSIDPSTGVISGTPTAAVGSYQVTVTASDWNSSDTWSASAVDSASTTFTLTVANEVLISKIADVSVHKDAALSPIQVQASGGTAPYTYAATGLPQGVSIDPGSGVISGTPTGAVGKHAVTVTVTDSGAGADQNQATAGFTLTETAALTSPANGDALAGLRINEVEATGTPANDWVEIYNTGADIPSASVDLTDGSGTSYTVPAQDFPAHGYVVVKGSDMGAAGLDLAANDTLYLSETGDDTLLDQTSWTAYPTTSWARYPDGTGDFAVSKSATQGAANSLPASADTDHLVIAAVFGANADGSRFTNDWVELYNPTDSPISLGTNDTSTSPSTVTPNYDLCYRSYSSTGGCSTLVKLYGTVSPHHYFFIWYANAHSPADDGTYPTGITPDLDFAVKTPTNGNQSGSNMGGCNTGGQIELLDTSKGTSPINGDLSSASAKAAGEVDGVGWMNASTNQPTAAESKGFATVTGVDSGTNNTCVIARRFANGSPVDADANSTDFTPDTDVADFSAQAQNDERVAITPVANTEVSINEQMEPIKVQAQAVYGALSFSATGLPAGVSIDPNTGVISGTPSGTDALQDYPVTVTVSDGVASDTNTVSFTLTLSKELRLDALKDVSVPEGAAISEIDVKAHGGTTPYTYAATGLPKGLSINPSTGAVTGTPTDALGRYDVKVSVTDSDATAQATVSEDFKLVELPSAGGPAAGDPLAALRINEVEATGTPANDWVELYNTGAAVTGAAVSLEDSAGDVYQVPTQAIAAGGYVVVKGSDLAAAGFDMAAVDTLYLTETGGATLLDQSSWTSYAPTSWARTTDGTGAFGVSAWPTQGTANSGAPVIKPNDLLVSEVNYDNNSTDYYEYSEVTNTTDHPIDFDAYGLSITYSGAAMTLHSSTDTTGASPHADPVIPAHGTQVFWWDENQYLGVKTTAQFLANYGLPASTPVILVQGFSSLPNSGGDHSYYISVNQGKSLISQSWVDTPCAANTFNGSSVCTATNGNYAEHFEVPADRTNPTSAVWYDSLHSGGDDINYTLKAALSTPGTVDLEQLGFTRAVKISAATSDGVTLHNTSTATVDLSGYVLQKNSSGTAYTLPAGTTVAAGSDLVIPGSASGLTFAGHDYVSLLAPRGYAYTDGVGIADTTGPFLHTLAYDASSGAPPVIDQTTGLPLPPAGGLYRPAGVSASGGTVYASNTGDNVLAAVSNGSNTIVAGSLEGYGDTGDGGPAAKAYLYQPGGTAEDAKGDIFIADSGDNVVREITPDGNIHLFAGTGNTGGAGEAVTSSSTATSVNLWHPESVAVDSNGDVFIADTFDNRVVEVTAAGTVKVVAGTGDAGYTGDGGAATSATLSEPAGVAVDALGDVYIADSSNNVIRRVDASTGVITTVAGNYAADQGANGCLGGFAGDGGPATSAELNDPQGVALDGAGDLFIADTFNNAIREVTPDGTITTLVNASAVAGSENTSPTGSGAVPASTHLNTPYAVGIDPSTNVLYIADTRNSAIAEVSNAGQSGNASGPVESAAALADSSSGTAAEACAAAKNGPVASTQAPTITGAPSVGSTLTATTGQWTPTPDSYTYQWLRDGVAIDGATKSTYTLAAADAGHQVSVSVTAAKADYASASATSTTVSAVAGTLTAATPTIMGTVAVGQQLTVNTGTWSAGSTSLPSSDLTYQWLIDGSAITGATSSTYTPVAADSGHSISVTVTGAYPGYNPASQTSSQSTVAAGMLTTATPVIKGSFKVGQRLTVSTGTWRAAATSLPSSDLSYQWLRNGKAIRGATKSTYTPVAADRGAKVSVTVTGAYTGYAKASATSSARTVGAGRLATTRPRIVGKHLVGARLTANAGTWRAGSVKLTGNHLKYQWFVGGKRVRGATHRTYKVAPKDKGRSITVKVTGSYAGYATASLTSKSIAAKAK